MEEYRYILECGDCESHLELTVKNENEFPCFCPMCGSDVSDLWEEKEEC